MLSETSQSMSIDIEFIAALTTSALERVTLLSWRGSQPDTPISQLRTNIHENGEIVLCGATLEYALSTIIKVYVHGVGSTGSARARAASRAALIDNLVTSHPRLIKAVFSFLLRTGRSRLDMDLLHEALSLCQCSKPSDPVSRELHADCELGRRRARAQRFGSGATSSAGSPSCTPRRPYHGFVYKALILAQYCVANVLATPRFWATLGDELASLLSHTPEAFGANMQVWCAELLPSPSQESLPLLAFLHAYLIRIPRQLYLQWFFGSGKLQYGFVIDFLADQLELGAAELQQKGASAIHDTADLTTILLSSQTLYGIIMFLYDIFLIADTSHDYVLAKTFNRSARAARLYKAYVLLIRLCYKQGPSGVQAKLGNYEGTMIIIVKSRSNGVELLDILGYSAARAYGLACYWENGVFGAGVNGPMDGIVQAWLSKYGEEWNDREKAWVARMRSVVNWTGNLVDTLADI